MQMKIETLKFGNSGKRGVESLVEAAEPKGPFKKSEKKWIKDKRGKWKPEPTLANARSYALWLLAKGMQTSEILRDKLLQKGYSKKDSTAVIAEMAKMKYLDDVNYTDVYFRNLLEFKNYGYFGVKLRLMRKKLPTEEVQRVMDEFSEKKELEIAKKFVSEQEKSSSRSTPEKLLRMLQNRGFRWPAISQALKKALRKSDLDISELSQNSTEKD
jgi:SOS response regulatory protein OraA/RecX